MSVRYSLNSENPLEKKHLSMAYSSEPLIRVIGAK
jgi:hypothetical protein